MANTPAVTHSDVMRTFGGDAATSTASNAEPRTQGVTETLAVGTTRRRFRGPKKNGHICIETLVDGAGGATSAMTVWYSNVPDPDVANDNDWVQDTTVGTIDLTVTGAKLQNIGNVFSAWVMIKAVVATSTANVRQFVRVEGTTVSGL